MEKICDGCGKVVTGDLAEIRLVTLSGVADFWNEVTLHCCGDPFCGVQVIRRVSELTAKAIEKGFKKEKTDA
jgi:hypothetical protein